MIRQQPGGKALAVAAAAAASDESPGPAAYSKMPGMMGDVREDDPSVGKGARFGKSARVTNESPFCRFTRDAPIWGRERDSFVAKRATKKKE